MVGTELSGVKVNLRPIRDDDLLRRAEWLNDVEIVHFFTGQPRNKPYGVADAELWRRTLENDPTTILWAIETVYNRHIGDVDLHTIDRFYKSAKLTILIGEKECWDCGYGTDAIRTLLHYAFTEMRLNDVDLRVFRFNTRGIRCYEKNGFCQTDKPSAGQMGASEPGEVYMTVSRERFLTEIPNAIAL